MFVYLKQTWSDHTQRRWRGKKTHSMPDSWKDRLPSSAQIVDNIDWQPANRKPLRAGPGRTKPNFVDYMNSTDPDYNAKQKQLVTDEAEAEVAIDLATAQVDNAAEAEAEAEEAVRQVQIAKARRENLAKARKKRQANLKKEQEANA